MSHRKVAAGFVAAALLLAPLSPALSQDSLPADPGVEVLPEVPTLGPELPAELPPSETVSAVVRTDDGSLEVATAEDQAALEEQTAGDTVLAIDTPSHRYAMALPADDAGRDLQWGLSRLQAEDLWQRTNGSRVTVAILDTGVKASHPDLKGKIAKGYNAITNKAGARADNNGHGTFLAGMIVGKTNGSGIAGLAPGSRILPVKVLDSEGVGDSDDIARGIIWAVDNGADVINMSFGADTSNRVEAEAIDYARGAGVTLVAAGGNEGARLEMYPAAYPGVLGVGATDFDNKAASFSNRGSHIDVVAPGQGIVSTYNGPKYTWTSGTSMSTAYVSAIAALAMSYSPGSGGEPLLQQIIATARDLGPEGRDSETGAGLVDPAALLQQMGAGRAPGMPRDIAATSPSEGVARVTFTPAGGTTYVVRFKKGKKAPATPSSGVKAAEGTGNWEPVTVDVPNKSPKARYGFAVFVFGASGTSRAIATLRPANWTLTGSRSVPRNSTQKLQVGLKLPSLRLDRWLAAATHHQAGWRRRERTPVRPDLRRSRHLHRSRHALVVPLPVHVAGSGLLECREPDRVAVGQHLSHRQARRADNRRGEPQQGRQ